MRTIFSFPVLPNHDKFMGGDKVSDIRGGDIHRVKNRFAIGDTDYITLQNVDSRNEQTLVYFDILPYLKLVCHPIQ
jgi:hypothetical protein